MNKMLIVILIAFNIGACNDNSYQKNENSIPEAKIDSGSWSSSGSTLKAQQPLQAESKSSVVEAQSSTPKITCMGVALNNWYAFDDYIEQPKCKKMEDFQIENFTCSIEDNAFDLGFKAANLTNYNEHRILAFRTSARCKEGLEIREANRETA